MIKKSLLIVCVILLSACSRTREVPLHLVCALDLSGSIASDGRTNSFEAVLEVFKTLKRGDSMTIIPITSDAEIEGSGRVLRFKLSQRREPYDGDLWRLAKNVEDSLQALLASASAQPYRYTDIMGTLELAREEFSYTQHNSRRVFLLLSDFIQDDPQYNFKGDKRLTNERSAKIFAAALAKSKGAYFENVQIYLGSIQSRDLRSLTRARRKGIRIFWMEFLSRQLANVKWATDGPGQLENFLSTLPRTVTPGV